MRHAILATTSAVTHALARGINPTPSVLAAFILSATLAHQAVADPPTHAWSQRFGANGDDRSSCVAVDASGNVFMAGIFNGTVNFGGGDFTTAPSTRDIVLAKYNALGVHQWSRQLGQGTGEEGPVAIATDLSGSVYVTGGYNYSTDLGGGILTAAGGYDIFLAKYDANGVYQWQLSFGSIYNDGAGLGIDSHGDVYIGGSFGAYDCPPETTCPTNHGAINFGSGILTSAGNSDLYLAKFNAAGANIWSKRFGGTKDEYAEKLLVAGADDVFMFGRFGAPDFGGGTLNSADGTLYFARFDPSGAHEVSGKFDSIRQHAAVAHAFAVDSQANIILGGIFTGTINLGGNDLVDAGKWDIFLAKYNPLGTHIWSQRFGGRDIDGGPIAIATDDDDNILVTGSYWFELNMGGGAFPWRGATDIFLTEFDPAGAHRWSRSFGGTYYENPYAMATLGNDILLTGAMTETVDFGGGGLVSVGGDTDIFLAKYTDETSVPVRITSFDARVRNGAIELTWDLWSDAGLDRFTLYRSDATAHAKVATEGAVSSADGSYLDTNVEPGRTYSYELAIITTDGDVFRSQTATVTTPSLVTTLAQNSPNPFVGKTTMEYTLSGPANVSLGIYDAAGRLVVRLRDGTHNAGTHRLEWDGRDANGRPVGSGVYFYRLEGVRGASPQKMVITR